MIMKVLVSYLERNQVFTLEGDDDVDQLRELKGKVSEKFDISNTNGILIQKYDKDYMFH